MKAGQVFVVLTAAALAGCQTMSDDPPRATAGLEATKGNKTVGEVTFEQVGGKVQVTAQIIGLKAGQEHGLHIHEVGDCSSGDGMKTRRRPAWHAFYGGPTSIEGLAEHLGHFSMYEIVYRDLSNRMHGGDLYGGVCVEDGHLSILGLLRTEDIKDWASVAATFGLSSIRLMVMHCRPEEITDGSFLRWYEADVKKWNAILDECAADGAMPEGHL
jgi:hypothetical protein